MLIKSIKKIHLQAIERLISNNNWITLVIIFALILLAMMKLLNPNKLLGYALAPFTPGFFKKKIEDNVSFLSPFYIVFFFFSAIVISLFLFLMVISTTSKHGFLTYFVLLTFTSFYFIIKYLLDFIISNTLGLSTITKYFITTKSGYLNSLSLWLFPSIILYLYSLNNRIFLLIIFGILFIFRAFLIIKNNKKIVIRKLFYFILYFCTLEIAPLLIVYKITTTT